MEITKGSDLILILKLEDFKGEKMRVADCADFRLYVWTANRNNFLQFLMPEITQEENIDKVAIPDYYMNTLESGVICYQYAYKKPCEHFDISDDHYDKSKINITDLYWRNCNLNEEPANPINYQTLNHLKNLIQNETNKRKQEIEELKEYVGTDFTDKLNAEIKRSNEVDIEFHKLIKQNASDCQNRDTELNEKLDAEIKRSNEVDVEIFNLIKGNKDENKEELNSTNDKLDAEIARSTQKDSDLENALITENNRAVSEETKLNTKLEGEIERAKTAEGAIRDAVENERDRATAKETLINDGLTSEIARAKSVEADITTSLQALKTSVNEEKQRSANKDTEHTNALNQVNAAVEAEVTRAKASEKINADNIADEITRAKAEEARIEGLINSNANKDNELKETVNAEITRAKAAEKTNADNITAEVTRAKSAEKDLNDAIVAEVARAKAKETELGGLIADNSTSIADEIQRATNAEKAITDNLNAEISRSTAKDTELNNALTTEVSRAKAEEARIEAKVDTNTSNLTSEIARAKKVESDITTALQSLKTSVSDKNSEYGDAITALQGEMIVEVNRAKTAEKANADAIAVINGDSSVVGSIAHSLSHANHYTDDKIKDLSDNVDAQLQLTLQSYATKIEVDERIKKVVGTAPEALDTLGEIAEVLNGNGDAIDAINGVLAGKADSSNVYTKNEIDTKTTSLTNSINSEIGRATAKESEIASNLANEITRAKAAEKTNADAIAIINSDKNTIGSIAHCLDDSKHYTDDEIAKIKAEQNTALANFATKNEVNTVNGKLTAHIAEAEAKYLTKSAAEDKYIDYDGLDQTLYDMATVDTTSYGALVADVNDLKEDIKLKSDKANTYTKTEVDDLIDGVDVTSQIQPISDRVTALEAIDHTKYLTSHQSLSDYAKKAETTAIKDENGNVITEMVIDNSSADDSVEVYTKEQCDERFAKIWSGTEAQYNAISVKDNNTIYIIL